MDISWHALNSMLHTEKQGFSYPWLSRHTHRKPAEVEPSFRKVSLLPAKLGMLFPTYLWVREFWPILPLTGPGLRPTVQNSS